MSVAFIYVGLLPFLEPSTVGKKIRLLLVALGGLTLFFFGFLDLYRYKLSLHTERLEELKELLQEKFVNLDEEEVAEESNRS